MLSVQKAVHQESKLPLIIIKMMKMEARQRKLKTTLATSRPQPCTPLHLSSGIVFPGSRFPDESSAGPGCAVSCVIESLRWIWGAISVEWVETRGSSPLSLEFILESPCGLEQTDTAAWSDMAS